MARWALLLRGVNVGRDNALPMAELRAMLEEAGCTRVRTLLQSGNAVLETRLGETSIARAVGSALEKRMGRPIDITLRTSGELRAILDKNPFAAEATDPARLCVTFLSRAPTAVEVAPLRDRDWSPERVQVVNREIYGWYPGGQARSPLGAAIGKLHLRGTVTTRNWNTVEKLARMAAEG